MWNCRGGRDELSFPAHCLPSCLVRSTAKSSQPGRTKVPRMFPLCRSTQPHQAAHRDDEVQTGSSRRFCCLIGGDRCIRDKPMSTSSWSSCRSPTVPTTRPWVPFPLSDYQSAEGITMLATASPPPQGVSKLLWESEVAVFSDKVKTRRPGTGTPQVPRQPVHFTLRPQRVSF